MSTHPRGSGSDPGNVAVLMRLAAMGTELVGVLAATTLTGFWIDSRFGTEPYAVVTGGVFGIGLGLYLMIRQAAHIAAELQKKKDDQESKHQR